MAWAGMRLSGPRENEEESLMEKMGTTKAARYIGTHRTTLRRLHDRGDLPADGTSPSGRPFWLRSTLDRHRLGQTTAGRYCHVDDEALPEISLSMSAKRVVLGRTTTAMALNGDSRALRISDLLRQLSQERPMALILPASTRDESLHKVISDVCLADGVAVVLLPA